MRNGLLMSTALFVVVLAACDRNPPAGTSRTDDAGAATAATATATASASARAPAAESSAPSAAVDAGRSSPQDGGVGDPHGTGLSTHCPTAAPGATVAIEDVPSGVAVAITGKAEAVTTEIRARAKRLLEADKTEADAGVRHDGRGGAGGRYGRCTIVMRNTSLESKEIPGGVRITVRAKDASEVSWLRKETRDREREAQARDGGL